MEASKTQSVLWQNPVTSYPQITRDILDVDVLIVGGGMTGISAAYYLRNSGLKVLLIEKGRISDQTSRGTGVLTPGLDMDFVDLVEKYSPEIVRTIIGSQTDILAEISKLIEKNNIECDYRKTGALVLAKDHEELEVLRREYQIRTELGLPCELIEDNFDKFIKIKGSGLMFVDGTVTFNQAKFILELSKLCKGVKFLENTPAESILYGDGCVEVESLGYTIRAKKVILAGGGENLKFLKLRRKIKKYTCYVISTRPLSDEEFKSLKWHKGRALWPLGLVYDFVRLTGDNRVMVCGEESKIRLGKDKQRLRFERLREFMVELFPTLKDVEIDHSWFGDIYYTKNEMPEFGEKNNIYYSFAYAGQGLLTAFEMGRIMATRAYGSLEHGEAMLPSTMVPPVGIEPTSRP